MNMPFGDRKKIREVAIARAKRIHPSSQSNYPRSNVKVVSNISNPFNGLK